jgi:hypothetical protein
VQQQEPNFAYLQEDAAAEVTGVLTDPDCYKGNRMQQVKTRLQTLETEVAAQVDAEIEKAKNTVAALESRLSSMSEFAALNADQRQQVTQAFRDFTASIEGQKLIAVIRDNLGRFEESEYHRLLSRVASWTQPGPKENAQTTEPNATPGSTPGSTKDTAGDGKPNTIAEPRIEYVGAKSISIDFDKAWLADETDVDHYLEAMREALLGEIRSGRRVQV